MITQKYQGTDLKIGHFGHFMGYTPYQELYAYLRERGIQPRLHVLDNECSKAIKAFLRSQDTDIQFVEPHNHCVNAAETAVKAAKYHMIAALATLDVTSDTKYPKSSPNIAR